MGYDVDGRDFIITNDDVKHIFDRHGENGDTTVRGGFPVTDDIIKLLPDIVKNPDNILPGKISGGKLSIIFEKNLSNGTVVYVQFDNAGREHFKEKRCI